MGNEDTAGAEESSSTDSRGGMPRSTFPESFDRLEGRTEQAASKESGVARHDSQKTEVESSDALSYSRHPVPAQTAS